MGLTEDVTRGLVQATLKTLDQGAERRLAGLLVARHVMPEADVYDRIRLSRYILTGSEDEDSQTEAGEQIRLEHRTQTEDYPFRSGDVLVLGPQVYASTVGGPAENTVLNWRGENFVPQRETTAAVVGPDPEFEEALEQESAPSSGEGWRGRRG